MSTEPSVRSPSFARDNSGMHSPHSIIHQFRDVGDTADKKVVGEIDDRHSNAISDAVPFFRRGTLYCPDRGDEMEKQMVRCI